MLDPTIGNKRHPNFLGRGGWRGESFSNGEFLPRGKDFRDYLLAGEVIPNFIVPHPPTPSPREFGQLFFKWQRL